MCTPMAAVSAVASIGSAAMQSRQANKNAAATQAEIDRQTTNSQELFDDRNTRLIEANDDQFRISGEEYDLRRGERRSTESEIARIMSDAVRTQSDIEARAFGEQAEAARSYNELLGGARERQAGYAEEGDKAVNFTVSEAGFEASEEARALASAKRNKAIQDNITAPGANDAMGRVPGAVARAFSQQADEGVSRARSVGAAGARVASYADSLRRADEVLSDGSEDLAAIGSKANRDLKKLGSSLTPFTIAHDSAGKIADLDIANVLAASERATDFEAERGGRVIEESADYETAQSAIIDDYVTTLNSSSTAYEEALRRNGQVRLSGLPKTSTLGGLFGALGSGTAGYASAGQGPSWGKVGSYLNGLGTRPKLTTGSYGLPASF